MMTNGEFQAGNSKGCLIILLVILVFAGAIYFFYTKHAAIQERGNAVDERVMSPYLRLIAAGKFEDAYNRYISQEYRRTVTLAQFVQAHQEHVKKYGVLKEWEKTQYAELHELFAKKTYRRVSYRLNFEKQRGIIAVYDLVKIGEDDKIDVTYGKVTSTLRSEVW